MRTAVDARTFGHGVDPEREGCFSGAKRESRRSFTVTQVSRSGSRDREFELGCFFVGVKTGAPHIAAAGHNHAEIKADGDAQALWRDLWYLGVASTDAEGTWVFRGHMAFSDPPRTYTKDVITRAGNLASM